MFKRRGFILVMFSLTLGLGAAWLANNWAQQRLAAPQTAESVGTRVVAAAVAIPYGTRVEPRHTRVIELPPGSVPSGHFNEPAQVEGQIALQSILPGEVLLQPRFSEHGGSTLAATIDPNMRAVTVRVNDVIGLAGFLMPNNRVDVLGTRSVDRRAVTETILRNIKVLAVDQTTSPEREDPVVVRAVTLEMTPAQAERLVQAREEGTLQLTLRNPLATEEEAAPPVVQAPPPAPRPVSTAPPPRPRITSVTVIRGIAVETVNPNN